MNSVMIISNNGILTELKETGSTTEKPVFNIILNIVAQFVLILMKSRIDSRCKHVYVYRVCSSNQKNVRFAVKNLYP